jgi:hypothetical protein
MLSAWQTIALSLVVALVTTLGAPCAIRASERRREKKVARRLVATEIERRRVVVDLILAHRVITAGPFASACYP